MVYIRRLLLGNFQVISSASENEIDQVSHGHCRVTLILSQPLGSGSLCIVALSKNLGCLYRLDAILIARWLELLTK
jgi:hypothetical protein